MSEEITQEQWQKAKEYFDFYLGIYLEMLGMPNVLTAPALMMTFGPLLRRYNSGERSRELYDEMMAVK